MYPKPLAVIALAFLLAGCASTTKPSASPIPVIAPETKAPPPAALMTLTAGTAHAGVRQDALATPEDVLAHIRDFGGYCRKLEAGYRALVDFMEGTP